MVGTKVIPLWVGAMGVEFQWWNLQSALESNINLVSVICHMICCVPCDLYHVDCHSHVMSA